MDKTYTARNSSANDRRRKFTTGNFRRWAEDGGDTATLRADKQRVEGVRTTITGDVDDQGVSGEVEGGRFEKLLVWYVTSAKRKREGDRRAVVNGVRCYCGWNGVVTGMDNPNDSNASAWSASYVSNAWYTRKVRPTIERDSDR